jgi:proline iminopeptidase
MGGSWGSCLALAYAIKYPKKVTALVLRGIFTGSQAEIDYFDNGQFKDWFPESWDHYLSATPAEHHHSPTAYHYKQILGGDEKAMRASACAYENMEGSIMALDDRPKTVSADDPAYDPTSIRIEVHYLANHCFMPDRHIFNNARKLTMPVWIVQGRYDMVCPPASAYRLHQLLPTSNLIFTIAGHSGWERETYSVVHAILLQLGQKTA